MDLGQDCDVQLPELVCTRLLVTERHEEVGMQCTLQVMANECLDVGPMLDGIKVEGHTRHGKIFDAPTLAGMEQLH